MPVMLHNGKVLMRGGKVAASKACCCGPKVCCFPFSLFAQLVSGTSKRVYDYVIPDDIRDFATGASSSVESLAYSKIIASSVGAPVQIAPSEYRSDDSSEDEITEQDGQITRYIHSMASGSSTYARIDGWDPGVGIGFAVAGEAANAGLFGGDVDYWRRYRNFTTICESKAKIVLNIGNTGDLELECRKTRQTDCILVKINGQPYCFGPCEIGGLPDCTSGFHQATAQVWDQSYWYWNFSSYDFGSTATIEIEFVCG